MHFLSYRFNSCFDMFRQPWETMSSYFMRVRFILLFRCIAPEPVLNRRAKYQSLTSGIASWEYNLSHQHILRQMNLHYMQCNPLLSICNKDSTLLSSVWFLHVLKLSHALTKHLAEFARDSSGDPVSFPKGISEPFIDSQLLAFFRG